MCIKKREKIKEHLTNEKFRKHKKKKKKRKISLS